VFIWRGSQIKWKRDLVVIENSRAALTGKWSPNGKKFAIGSGDHEAYIGEYEQNNNWWNTHKIGKFKSSVISLAFHPSGRVIAIGSMDYSI